VEFFTYATKTLPNGRVISVDPLTFGRARINIGDGFSFYEDGW